MDERIAPNCGCRTREKTLRGLCLNHYAAAWKNGTHLQYPRERDAHSPVCRAPGCEKASLGGRYCGMHRSRLQRRGTLDDPPRPVPMEDFFREHISTGVTDDDCWLWTGTLATSGYGRIGGRTYAHRYSWELHNQQRIPRGMEVLHSCDNPPCVNPAHLRVGTHAENMADMARRGRAGNGRRSG